MKKVSKYLSYNEIVKSKTAIKKGIDNDPSPCQIKNIVDWAINIFDPVREFVSAPLGCWTIYRSPDLNKAIGGANHSQHMANNGAAGDIDSDIYKNGNNKDIFNYIKNNLDFDQLIAEGLQNGRVEWIHCSYVSSEKNRKQVLLMYVKNGKTIYENYSDNTFEKLLRHGI